MGHLYEALLFVGFCLTKNVLGDTNCIAISGACQINDIYCSGGYSSGLCSGANNRRCCLPPAAGDESCINKYGACQDINQLCAHGGSYQSGLCTGPWSRKCCVPAATLTNSLALGILSAHGMTWSSSGNCNVQSNGACTSFTGMRGSTLFGLVVFKQALPSSCPIVITGGTETGHSSGTYSHGNGYKIDIRLQTCVYDYITTTYTQIADRGDGSQQWEDSKGNIYALESNHWDITYY